MTEKSLTQKQPAACRTHWQTLPLLPVVQGFVNDALFYVYFICSWWKQLPPRQVRQHVNLFPEVEQVAESRDRITSRQQPLTFFSFLPKLRPGVPFSTTMHEMPLGPGPPVRHMTTQMSDSPPPLMKACGVGEGCTGLRECMSSPSLPSRKILEVLPTTGH